MQELSQTPSIINSLYSCIPALSHISIVCPGLSIGICVSSEQCLSARFVSSRVMCLCLLCLQLLAQFSFRWFGFITFLFPPKSVGCLCASSWLPVRVNGDIPLQPEQQQREDHYSVMHCYRQPYVLASALASRKAFAMMKMLGQQALGVGRLRCCRGSGLHLRSCRIFVCRSSCPLWKNA